MLVSKSFPEGCTFFDVVLQCYASLNLMPKFIEDNNIQDLNLITTAGQTFVFEKDLIVDEFINDEIVKNNYQYCTGSLIKRNETTKVHLLCEDGEILSDETTDLFII